MVLHSFAVSHCLIEMPYLCKADCQGYEGREGSCTTMVLIIVEFSREILCVTFVEFRNITKDRSPLHICTLVLQTVLLSALSL